MLKAPSDKRNTWLNGVIQIMVTRACDLSCTGCTQGSNLSGKPVIMTLENFEIACWSLRDYYGVVGMFGGNPCLHPDFEALCDLMTKWIPFERRGLWSNNLNGYGKLCREIFNPAYSNLNVHCSEVAYNEMKRDWPESHPKGTTDSRHSPPYVALKDTELDREEQWNLIQNCDINQFWSAMIGQFRGDLRAWFCELAGAQSMLHEHEYNYPDTGLAVKDGWWKRELKDFNTQIQKHCFECGIPLRGFGDLAVKGKNEYVSKIHELIYNLKRPGSKIINKVSDTKQLNGHVRTATNYIENGALMQDNVKVLIGVPTQEMARRADFYDYIDLLEKPNGTAITKAHGQSPARNRNLIIEQALTHNCTHILFLDDDVVFKPDLLNNLLKHDVDIVTGLYLMRNYPHRPIIFDYADSEGRCRHLYPQDGNNDLVPIVAAGLGACLIKTSIFAKLEKPYIRLGELEKDHWCDDISFFKRCREIGIEMYCDLSQTVGHMAQVTIWPTYHNEKWMTTYDTAGDGQVTFPSVKPEVLAMV